MEGKELTLEVLAAQLQELKSGKAGAEALQTELQEQNAQLKEQNEKLKQAIEKLISSRVGNSITSSERTLPKVPEDPTFKLNKVKYEILVPSCHIPELGYRTAEDIRMDEQAQKALIDLGSFAIRKIS